MRVGSERRLGLSRHADLKVRSEGDLLVLPERAIRIGGSGGEILRICSTGLAASTVVATMRQRYPEADGLEVEVRAFLNEMLEIGGLVELDEAVEASGSAADD